MLHQLMFHDLEPRLSRQTLMFCFLFMSDCLGEFQPKHPCIFSGFLDNKTYNRSNRNCTFKRNTRPKNSFLMDKTQGLFRPTVISLCSSLIRIVHFHRSRGGFMYTCFWTLKWELHWWLGIVCETSRWLDMHWVAKPSPDSPEVREKLSSYRFHHCFKNGYDLLPYVLWTWPLNMITESIVCCPFGNRTTMKINRLRPQQHKIDYSRWEDMDLLTKHCTIRELNSSCTK